MLDVFESVKYASFCDVFVHIDEKNQSNYPFVDKK